MLELGQGPQGWIISPCRRCSFGQKQWQLVLMIWRPSRCDIEVGQGLFESLSSKLSTDQLHSEWMNYDLPNEAILAYLRTDYSTLMDLHFETYLYLQTDKGMYMWNQVNCIKNHYTKSRNQFTLQSMVVSEGVMSSSFSMPIANLYAPWFCWPFACVNKHHLDALFSPLLCTIFFRKMSLT